MYKMYTQCQVNLMNLMRMLWEQHVYWTRFFIISTAADLDDLEPVTNRLLENPGDFAAALCPFYPLNITDTFKMLLTEHIKIGGDLVNATKNQDCAKVNEIRREWYMNADDISKFLSDINPYWNENQWRTFMYSHLEMTEEEAVLRLNGKYTEDIQTFDMIEKEALEMADYMACGLICQFSYK